MTIAPEPAHRHKREGGVLVVENDRSVQKIIRLTLEAEGLTVDAAASSRGALECVARRWPDVLVLDMGLPAQDGAWLVDTLRDTYGRVPPVLLVTADGEAARKARRVGAFCYLAKPFDLVELATAVRDGMSVEPAAA